MQQWIITGIKYLSEGSNKSDNSGHYPIQARYKKSMINIFTKEQVEITDLDCKKLKRDNALNEFFSFYGFNYVKEEITILSIVIDASKYDTIATFNNSFGKKLKRKGLKRLGYVWVRDIGEIEFEKHFHILIATSRICGLMFRSLFEAKNDGKYEVQFLKTKNGMKEYIKRKELYAANKQRSYGKSRSFLSHK